jgi:hypothetical protein
MKFSMKGQEKCDLLIHVAAYPTNQSTNQSINQSSSVSQKYKDWKAK